MLVLCGCTQSRRDSLKWAAGGATACGLGVVIGAGTLGGDDEPPRRFQVTTAVLFFGGGLIALVATLSAIIEPDPTPRPPVLDHDRARRATARARAWEVTKAAAAAARTGDCASARAADVEVEALDGELHAIVFLRDAAIARCLAAR
jgi:hypothetical protein